MPGKAWRKSIRRPRTYEALRRRGLTKTVAAKIANSRKPKR